MFSVKNESRVIRISIAVILCLFFTVCLYTIFKYGNSTLLGSLETYNNDDVKYIRSANLLSSTGNLTYKDTTSPTVFIMPGLPYVLSFFMRIFGIWEGVAAFRVFQAILQTASLLLVFFIGRKVFNSKVGLLAVLLNALYIPEIWASNIILTEAIFKFLFLLLIYICIYAVEEKKLGYYIGGGIVWGLSALFRPPVVLFPIVILLMWIKNKYKISEIIKYTLIASAIFVMVLSPWWIRNYKLFDKFIPFTMSTGNPMLQGTYINYNEEDGSDNYIDRSPFKYSEDEIENNEVEVGIAKLRMKTLIPKEPFKYLYWYTIGKTLYQWKDVFYWGDILGFEYHIVKNYHLLLVFSAIISMFFYHKKRAQYSSFLILIYSVVYINCIYLPFYCFPRYVYPVIPLIIIPVSFMLLEIKSIVKVTKPIKKIEPSL